MITLDRDRGKHSKNRSLTDCSKSKRWNFRKWVLTVPRKWGGSVHPLKPLSAIRVQFQKNKQQDRKAPQGRSTITKERQRYTDRREQADRHSNVDSKVREEQTGY